MKLLIAVVHRKDSASVGNALIASGIVYTKIGSTGGFLKAGNTTLIIGVEDSNVDSVLDIIRAHCATRTESVPVSAVKQGGATLYKDGAGAVEVGGATVFITSVERFEKM